MSDFGIFRRPVLARLLSTAALCAASVAVPAFASVYTEIPDAGETVSTAQIAYGAAPLTSIQGSLGEGSDWADLFLINIVDPNLFSATTAGTSLDTQLFLFALDGKPIYMNDDLDGFTLASTLPAGSSFGPPGAGQYLLAVALAGYDPENINGQLLFTDGLPTDVRGPVDGLQPALLGGFTGSPFFDESGRYNIQLTGTSGASGTVPEPTSALLALLGFAACGWLSKSRRGASASACIA